MAWKVFFGYKMSGQLDLELIHFRSFTVNILSFLSDPQEIPHFNMTYQLLALILLAMFHQISCHQQLSETYPHQYNPYSYGYDSEDNYGNKQWRQEKSSNPMEVHGSYGYRDNNGLYREVTYVADKNGFRANIKTNEPGIAGTRDPANVKIESHHQAAIASAPSPTYHRYIPSNQNYYNPKV